MMVSDLVGEMAALLAVERVGTLDAEAAELKVVVLGVS